MNVISASIIAFYAVFAFLLCFACGGLIAPHTLTNPYIPTSQILVCRTPVAAAGYALEGVLIAASLLLILAACFLAFKTRHVDSAYNESRFVAITSYVCLELALIFLPIIYTTEQFSGNTGFFVRSSVGLCLLLVVIVLLLLPKVINIRKELAEQQNAGPELDSTRPPRILDENEDQLALNDCLDDFSDESEEQRFRELLDPRRFRGRAQEPLPPAHRPGEFDADEVPFQHRTQSGGEYEDTLWTGPSRPKRE